MIIGPAIYIICSIGGIDTLRHDNLRGFGAWLTLSGTVLLLFGWRAMAILWFPLVYLLVFGQYISEAVMKKVTEPMQDVTARGAGVVLSLFLDVERAGNTLYIHEGGKRVDLNIADACSGMRMLMAMLALGVAMAYTGLKHIWQRIALVIMAVPTAIFVNILRVVTLAALSLLDTGFAAGDFHTFIGLLWLVPAFLIFLGIMWIIRNIVVEESNPARKAA
jgi:exosortase